MKNILLVDDEEAFLASAVDGLAPFAAHLTVYTARNGKEALLHLASRSMDLVVTDLKMPGIDGFELLVEMNRLYPTIPVIVITAFGTPEVEDQLYAHAVLGYLEKPFDIQDLAARIFDGLAMVSHEFQQEVFSLRSFMELIQKEGKTCTLIARSGDRTGTLYFLEGTLIDTQTDLSSGEEAVFDILDWDDAVISIFNRCEHRTQKVFSPIRTILESSRRAREQTQNTIKKREVPARNVKKLQEAVSVLKEKLGDGLIAADIWVISDATSIAGYNSNPQAVALFNQVTDFMEKTLDGSGFPKLGKYFLIDLVGEKFVLILPMGEFRWGMLIDRSKVQLGLVLSIALPKAIGAFEEAITG